MKTQSLDANSALLAPLKDYVGNIRTFKAEDWVGYACWIGMIAMLFVGVTLFLIWGSLHGVEFPGFVWFIPLGTAMFLFALSIDDIGHRTLYKAKLQRGEGHVHKMIGITAVTSVMALCLCYEHGETFRTPALALIGLSLFYSVIDEALHWHRYLSDGVDRVEMWSHFVAITGHVLMIAAWWQWFTDGYVGVAATVEALPW